MGWEIGIWKRRIWNDIGDNFLERLRLDVDTQNNSANGTFKKKQKKNEETNEQKKKSNKASSSLYLWSGFHFVFN